MSKIIGIISLKGGVGKTSSVIALGDAIADRGKRVLLVDGNLSAPNLGLHLDLINPEKTLHHVLDKKANISEAIYNIDNMDILPASRFFNFNINPLKLKDKLKNIRNKYDFILIDSSPALNDETLASMLASDELFIVTTPDYPTLSTTLRAIKLAKQRGTKIDGLILNKVYDKDFELSLKDIEETVGVPILAVIPNDLNVLRALSEFKPLTRYKPKSNASKEYCKLACALIGERENNVKLKRFFKWVNPKIQDINRDIFYQRVFDD